MNQKTIELQNKSARRKTIKDHIRLLEHRYPEPVRREAVAALQERLRLLEETAGTDAI